ncbi:MAG: hypothetical protein JO181_14915 [Solirubrobacterales bacterium]|nr:hypothetical protein [Solirubrobacterales bacterium]
MPNNVHRSAEFTVRLPPDQTMPLFTAEGERRWAEGWDPRYPNPARRDGAGAVFTTAHGANETTWIMVDHGPERVRYARVTDSMTAGIVAVDVLESDERVTCVRVTYDLTAFTAAGEEWLAEFDAHYDTEIASWATDIAAALERPEPA